MLPLPVRYFPFGSSSILVEWEPILDPELNTAIHALAKRWGARTDVEETIPAYSSLLIIFSKNIKHPIHKVDELKDDLNTVNEVPRDVFKRRKISLPVCYEDRFALDIEAYKSKGMDTEEIIIAHSSTLYHVYMLGFLPGFPYMGIVPDKLAMPRKVQPREKIPRGSVGVANKLTGIYPQESPGGWNIIGRCPLSLFEISYDNPSFIQAGDSIQFYPISEDEYFQIKQDVHQNRYDISQHILA